MRLAGAQGARLESRPAGAPSNTVNGWAPAKASATSTMGRTHPRVQLVADATGPATTLSARAEETKEHLMANRSIAAGSRDLALLRHRFQGPVLLPDEDGYHTARRVWNAMVDQRPAVIARCASPADVAAAISFARAQDLELGVRCGGHSVLGISVPRAG
jgi:hypothetical protein